MGKYKGPFDMSQMPGHLARPLKNFVRDARAKLKMWDSDAVAASSQTTWILDIFTPSHRVLNRKFRVE